MMENDKPRLPAGERSLQSGRKTTTADCKGNWLDRMSHTDRRKSYVFMSRCYWKRKVSTQTVQTSLRNKNETDEILCRLKNSCFWHIRQKTASQLGAGAGEAHVWVYRWIQIRSGGLWSWFFGVRFPSSIIIIIEILNVKIWDVLWFNWPVSSRNISTATGWIKIEFCPDIHGSQRINWADKWTFIVAIDKSDFEQLLDGFSQICKNISISLSCTFVGATYQMLATVRR